jgi:hypothetical protein
MTYETMSCTANLDGYCTHGLHAVRRRLESKSLCATQGHHLDSRCIIYGENADRLQVSGEKSSGSRSKVDQYTAKSKMDLAHGWYPCRTSLENRYEINLRTL